MKYLLAFGLAAGGLALGGCAARAPSHYSYRPYYHHSQVVIHRGDDPYDPPPYRNGEPAHIRTAPRYPHTPLVYYADQRGRRYYVQGGRRIYLSIE